MAGFAASLFRLGFRAGLLRSRAGLLRFRAGLLRFRAGLLRFRAGLLRFRAGLLSFRAGLLRFRTGLLGFRSDMPRLLPNICGFCQNTRGFCTITLRVPRLGFRFRAFLAFLVGALAAAGVHVSQPASQLPKTHQKRTKGPKRARGLPGVARSRTAPSAMCHENTMLGGFDDGELHNKNPPTPCLWQAPVSTQKAKRKTRPAIRRSARWRVSRLGGFPMPSPSQASE